MSRRRRCCGWGWSRLMPMCYPSSSTNDADHCVNLHCYYRWRIRFEPVALLYVRCLCRPSSRSLWIRLRRNCWSCPRLPRLLWRSTFCRMFSIQALLIMPPWITAYLPCLPLDMLRLRRSDPAVLPLPAVVLEQERVVSADRPVVREGVHAGLRRVSA